MNSVYMFIPKLPNYPFHPRALKFECVPSFLTLEWVCLWLLNILKFNFKVWFKIMFFQVLFLYNIYLKNLFGF